MFCSTIVFVTLLQARSTLVTYPPRRIKLDSKMTLIQSRARATELHALCLINHSPSLSSCMAVVLVRALHA